ncbi:MAG: hypothetical protein RR162_00145 [Oscillospiraceae bacterium]
MQKTVSKTNWENRAKTIETKNLSKYHNTPHWLSILREMDKSVIETIIGSSETLIVFDEEKYKKIREHCTGFSYITAHTPFEGGGENE